MFLAHQLALSFSRLGWGAEIQAASTVSPSQRWELDLYVVICPQMFRTLPPLERSIAFQMEQSVSPRWFTDAYLEILCRARAVLDYSRANVAYLQDRGVQFQQTFWVPIGGIHGYRSQVRVADPGAGSGQEGGRPLDVLFYGDASSPRRKAALAVLREHFQVHVASGVFGTPLYALIARARVVVNIHYYERALLETTRIYECLSLGATVVSESTEDLVDHPTLAGAVHFVPSGNYFALIATIQRILLGSGDGEPSDSHSAAVTEREVRRSQERFDFMLYRALYAQRLLSHDEFAHASSPWALDSDRVVLSLPESVARRRAIEQQALPDCYAMFDGIRYVPGWIGCGLSYAFLARKALLQSLPALEIMEDDALPGIDYARRRPPIDAWLQANRGKWDVFCGLIARVHPETVVLAVDCVEGSLLVTVDRMISTVHNIYAASALAALAAWEPARGGIEDNTIDRYLQGVRRLRAVVAIPFLAAHGEEQRSTLWDFPNAHYARRIAEAEQAIAQLARAFQDTKGSMAGDGGGTVTNQ
jgi:hypothetical protein